MRKLVGILFLICCVAPSNVVARECSKFEAYAAESLYPYLSSWGEMHRAYRAYGHCDDGAIAEGFDEAISLLWEKHWELVPEMLREAAVDADFRQFVFKRIGSETVPLERWREILSHAKDKCPANAGLFCQEVIANGLK